MLSSISQVATFETASTEDLEVHCRDESEAMSANTAYICLAPYKPSASGRKLHFAEEGCCRKQCREYIKSLERPRTISQSMEAFGTPGCVKGPATKGSTAAKQRCRMVAGHSLSSAASLRSSKYGHLIWALTLFCFVSVGFKVWPLFCMRGYMRIPDSGPIQTKRPLFGLPSNRGLLDSEDVGGHYKPTASASRVHDRAASRAFQN